MLSAEMMPIILGESSQPDAIPYSDTTTTLGQQCHDLEEYCTRDLGGCRSMPAFDQFSGIGTLRSHCVLLV